MPGSGFLRFLYTAIVLTFVILLLFALSRWLQVPGGRLLDWVIVVVMAWWLLAIVTGPWDVHFQTREVLAEAEQSAQANIPVPHDQLAYVRRWQNRSLVAALALHLISAIGLYLVAAWGVSFVGYFGAAAALLLTGLRPAARAHTYLLKRLAAIKERVRYPREDIVKLQVKVEDLRQRLANAEKQLDLNQEGSWATRQTQEVGGLREEIQASARQLARLADANQTEHDHLTDEIKRTRDHLARGISETLEQAESGQKFAIHLREILRFIKES